MTVQKSEIQMRLASHLKRLRSEIRLKHSLEADNELNATLPKAEKAFLKEAQKGNLE